MIKKQDKSDYNFGNNPSELDLDGLMEILLKNKKYATMKTVLDFLNSNYDKYEYYLGRMQEAKRNVE